MAYTLTDGGDHTYRCSAEPVYDETLRHWKCVDMAGVAFNVLDPARADFTITDADLPTLTPMQFYLAFTPAERIAIKGSKDPMVAEFWETFGMAQSSGHPIDPNLSSISEALAYMAAKATDTPPGAGILAAARIPDFVRGVAQ
jgi:hypothetical protein